MRSVGACPDEFTQFIGVLPKVIFAARRLLTPNQGRRRERKNYDSAHHCERLSNFADKIASLSLWDLRWACASCLMRRA